MTSPRIRSGGCRTDEIGSPARCTGRSPGSPPTDRSRLSRAGVGGRDVAILDDLSDTSPPPFFLPTSIDFRTDRRQPRLLVVQQPALARYFAGGLDFARPISRRAPSSSASSRRLTREAARVGPRRQGAGRRLRRAATRTARLRTRRPRGGGRRTAKPENRRRSARIALRRGWPTSGCRHRHRAPPARAAAAAAAARRRGRRGVRAAAARGQGRRRRRRRARRGRAR